MNRRKIAACMILTMSVGLFGACGKEEEPPVTEEVIQVSFNTEVKPPNQMSKAELMALTPNAIKEMVETYLPNYRAIYSISENYVMAAEDWTNLRDLICDQLYGFEKADGDEQADAGDEYEIPSNIDFKQPDKILGDDGSYLDPDWIFYAPCKEFVDQLDDDEFIDYLEMLMAYWKKDDVSREDFENMDEEGLAKVREMVYSDFCVPWGSVSIPTVKQLTEGTVDSGSDSTEEAGIFNENIQSGIQTALDAYKKELKKEDLMGGNEDISEAEEKVMDDFLVSFKTYEVTESDVKSFTAGLDITEETTYDEFIELYTAKISADGWTTTDKDGNSKAIETKEEAEEYMCSLIAINLLMQHEASTGSDAEDVTAQDN